MKDNKKINLTDTQEKRKTNITFKQFIKRGFSQISYNRWKTIVFTILTTILIITLLNFKNFNFNIPFVTENIIIAFINDICNIDIPQNILIPILLTILYILMVIALMIPIGYKEKEEILYKAKFINNKKETSIFIRQFLNKLNKNVVIWEFLSNGVPYSYWLEHQEELDSSFDDYYVRGIKKKGKRILLYLSKNSIDYSKPIYFNPKHDVVHKNFRVPIGINQFDEPVYWNLSIIPHAMGGRRN